MIVLGGNRRNSVADSALQISALFLVLPSVVPERDWDQMTGEKAVARCRGG